MDSTGKEVIKPYFDRAHNFSNGFAEVSLEDSWGIIDKKGKMVFPCQNEGTRILGKGFFGLKKNGKWALHNLKGPITEYVYDDLSEHSGGLFPVKKSGKWGYLNSSGQEVIPIKYEKVTPLVGGIAAVQEYYSWIVIDVKGNKVMKNNYSEIIPISSNALFVMKRGESLIVKNPLIK